MLEFPTARNDWRLDVVSILAILGEGNIKLNAPAICRSWACLLPRLMPAPQGLLGERMKVLPYQSDINSVITESGKSTKSGLNYLASILHGCGREAQPYSVREYKIETTSNAAATPIRTLWYGPLNVIMFMSFLITIGLFVYAVVLGDGPAMIGILVMALASSVISLGSKYRVAKPEREKRVASQEKTIVVFCNREGVFTVVHCTVGVAEQLYFRSETCDYFLSSSSSRACGGVAGGLALIVAVFLFGNASWKMQAALITSFTVLNVAYWAAAVLPLAASWDTSSFSIKCLKIHERKTYTCAIHCAADLSNSVKWIFEGGFLPRTNLYEQWVLQIRENMRNGVENWDSFAELREISKSEDCQV